MPWYKKPQFTALKARPAAQQGAPKVPEGLWHRCPACLTIIYARDFENNLRVCTSCGFHEKLSSQERVEMLVDEGSFEELDADIRAKDPLGFVDSKPYGERLKATQRKTGLMDAVRTGLATIGGQRVSLSVMDFGFIGGSMGSVVGEKVTRAIERGIRLKIPVITVVTSGGARMQESTYSLMQMAKTAAALARLDDARLPHIVILANPSTAGVMASYGSLGDVIIAEPDALIGFAGPRVIEQTIKQILPRGFQRSEFVRDHGFLDIVCHRTELRETVAKLLGLLRGPEQQDLDGSLTPLEAVALAESDNGRHEQAGAGETPEPSASAKSREKATQPKKPVSPRKRTTGAKTKRSSR
jgi:acetyl-CoA carboxylase carboxyl transferase subunit beta